MTADEALEQHVAFINEIGEDVVFRRFTGSGSPRPHTDVTTKARVMGYQPSQLVGTIVQGDRRVIALAGDIVSLLPITTNDQIVVRGKVLQIKSIDDNTRRIGGTLIALELQVGG